MYIDESLGFPMIAGIKIPGYRIERELGQGAMGVVYQARQIAFERPVAIKMLHPYMASDLDLLDRFEREAQTVIALDHPNIVAVLDYGTATDIPYIVMEYIEGVSLDRLLQGGPLTLPEVRCILGQIASGLDHAHAQGVVHRDVKPANVLIRSDGVAMLSDFGIARTMSAEHVSRPGLPPGTPAYMSPEVCRGEPSTPQSDLYALGVLLYEMVTGHLPFNGQDIMSVIYQQLHEDPPDPEQYASGLKDPVCAVLTQTLEKDPSRRFPSANALAQAFTAALQRNPAASVFRKGSLPFILRKLFLTITAVLLLALLIFSITIFAGSHNAPESSFRSRQGLHLQKNPENVNKSLQF